MKKGFTLVELLAIVIVLGIIVTIVTPIINNQVTLAQNEAYNVTVNSIEEAARRYGTVNLLGYDTNEQKLELSTLVDAGFIAENDLVNPKTETIMTGCVYYKWNETNKVYEYRYDPNC